MKITIDIPEKIMKYAATTLNLVLDDELENGKIDEIVSSMNEEPFVLELDETSGSKNKQLMVGIAMIAIAKHTIKLIKDILVLVEESQKFLMK